MIEIGRFNLLEVIEADAIGVTLDGGPDQRLVLAAAETAERLQPGDRIDVFIYIDSGGKPAATTQRPLALMGEVAWLKVVEVNELGAFVDWGLPKDLFIPFAEQQHTLRKGDHALVIVYLDNRNRIAGSTRIDHWVKDDPGSLKAGDKVSLVIADRTELGFKAIINHRCWGLLYGNELFRKLHKGQVTEGYIKQVRGDNKVDLTLDKPGFSRERIDSLGQQIIDQLKANDGRLPLTDKSPPEEIYATFGVSKKVFKKAIGGLYKQRRIKLDSAGISLVEP